MPLNQASKTVCCKRRKARFRRTRLLLSSLPLTVLALSACTEAARDRAGGETATVYESRPSQQAGGTGRFYLGREIAEMTGSEQDTAWLERPTRETAELPGRLVRALELEPSDVVADIGAGTGYFTFRLSEAVPEGKVFAVDVQPDMLAIIRERMAKEEARNVEPVLGTEKTPNLPDTSVDVALIVDAYHEFTYPREMTEHMAQALRPGGRLVLVAYRGEDPTLPVGPLRRITQAQARKEMEAVGLRWRETKAILPQHHFMVFEKPSG